MTARRKTDVHANTTTGFVSQQIPLYYQLASVVRDQILSGRYAVGARIPTEADLVAAYGVSRITVRQALSSLEQEGLVRREVGRGTYVTGHRPFTGRQRVEGSLDDLISIVQSTSVQLLDLRTTPASQEDAMVLGVAPGDPVVQATRLRLHHGEPYGHLVNVISHEYGRRLSKRDWQGSVLRVLEDKLKLHLRDADQNVRAALADAGLARALGTRVGAPLLAVDRVVRLDDGRPLLHTRVHYRSDVYSFTIHLSRDRTARAWAVKHSIEDRAAKRARGKKTT
jgi:GntR family transcriptional regulator